MYIRSKLFVLLVTGFLLLLLSLYISSRSISKTSEMIDYIETKQLKLFYLANQLNYDIKSHQADVLQALISTQTNYEKGINNSFKYLNINIDSLNKFISNNKLNINGAKKKIGIIKKRMVGYKAVEDSLLKALKNKNSEDIEDALYGFNSITIKFSQNINKIIKLSDNALSTNIAQLKKGIKKSQSDIIYSFVIAILLIIFSIYKLFIMQNSIKKELNRAEEAEKEQNILQQKLLQYNENLENEIASKTEEIKSKVYTHLLSGLPNRNKLLEDIHQYKFKQIALLNIDKFQKFNDVYGEDIGNIAITKTAEFLNSQINSSNMVLYHIGGDEFVYVIKHSTNTYDNKFIKNIEIILHNYSKENFTYKDKRFNLMMSAGLDFSSEEKMLAYADMALKDAKRNNLSISIYNQDKEIEKHHEDDMDCHKKLLHAFDTNGIKSFFQPIAPIQDDNLPMKYESLVRIVEDNGNVISPFRFIDVAKQNRVYYKLTKIVTQNTLDVISKYKVRCSLNLSIKDIENERTLEWLYSKLDDYNHPEFLTIELLETEDFKDYTKVFEFCTKIRSYGIKIALDDFGSGYANFTHILNLPIDYIKIDASLISNIDRNQQSRIMVETIVNLAKKLHVQTIAEFVSSKEILEVVKSLGVDYSQGFYTGRPEPIETFIYQS